MSFVKIDRLDMTLQVSTLENNMKSNWEGKVYFFGHTEKDKRS